MRGTVLNRYLTSTALALLLTVCGSPAFAGPEGAAIEAAVPVPESANVPPPSVETLKPAQAQAVTPAVPAAAPPAQAAAPAIPAVPASAQTAAPAAAPAQAATETAAPAQPPVMSPAEVKAAVPKPETADVPPVTVKELLASPASDRDPADLAVADKLKEMVNGKLSSLFERKSERTAVETFYAGRGFSPVWIEKGAATTAAKAAIARLKAADQDGLFPSDYPTPDFAGLSDPAALARADLQLTESVLTYARHASSGRVSYTRVSGDIAYPDHTPEPAAILAKVTAAADAAAALDSYNPPQALYKALKAKLAEARGKKDEPEEVVRIPEGKLLRAGDSDPRVVLLRKRLNVTSDPSNEKYDDAVVAAVKEFQKSKDLNPDGIVGSNTVQALNGGPKLGKTVDTIIANMERWRWLPRDLGAPSLGDAYVILNIPDYTLRVMQHGKQVWKTRVVVGKTGSHATPLLSETMKYITVNPTWNVPPSIVYNEYLPALQQDPTVLQRMGLKLEQNRDGSVHISQPPGEANALGRIRFNFPNKFLVYQHDTPDKYLFAKETRAYSHGCMRVQYPDKYAEVLLGIALPQDHYTVDKIHSMYGHSEQNINLPTPIPVNITYQTAFVDDDGKLELRPDIYGRDAQVLAQLRDGERKVADIPIERSQPNYSRPPVTLPAGVAFAGDSYNSGPSFFERLFGIGPSDPSSARGYRRSRTYAR